MFIANKNIKAINLYKRDYVRWPKGSRISQYDIESMKFFLHILHVHVLHVISYNVCTNDVVLRHTFNQENNTL